MSTATEQLDQLVETVQDLVEIVGVSREVLDAAVPAAERAVAAKEAAEQIKQDTQDIKDSFLDRLADIISVNKYLNSDSDDIGAAVNAAIAAARTGSIIICAPSKNGAPFIQTTTIKINKTVFIDFGKTVINVPASAGALTCIELSALRAKGRGGIWYGERVTGSVWLKQSGYQSVWEDGCAEKFGILAYITGNPYAPCLTNIKARNMKTGVLHIEDAVGARIDGLQHAVDGPWNGGTYGYPDFSIKINCEGNIITNPDLIWSGPVIVEALHRHVYWNKFSGGFLADSYAGGLASIIIRNNSSYRCDGTFFDNIWSSAGNRGFAVQGTSKIDGIYVNGGTIQGNLLEALRIDNALADNIVFDGVTFCGNSRNGQGAANTVETGTAGRVSLINCRFGRANGWTEKPYTHVFANNKQTGEVDLSGSWLERDWYTEKPIFKGGTGDIIIEGVTGVRRKNRGVAAINGSNNEFFKVVSHGLDFPIIRRHVSVTPPSIYTTTWGMGAAKIFGVKDFETSPGTFQIVVDVPPGSGNILDFAWIAEIDRL